MVQRNIVFPTYTKNTTSKEFSSWLHADSCLDFWTWYTGLLKMIYGGPCVSAYASTSFQYTSWPPKTVTPLQFSWCLWVLSIKNGVFSSKSLQLKAHLIERSICSSFCQKMGVKTSSSYHLGSISSHFLVKFAPFSHYFLMSRQKLENVAFLVL